ncbi:MAG: PilZ domain-containing protein [Terriglobia bacterium]
MGTTPTQRARATDRVTINIQITIFGADMDGRAYSEEACTLEVSRNGALILADRNLTPQEEILIRRERTGKEAAAQIVGQVRKGPDGFVYGVKLLDPSVNLWDINFVPLTEAERAVGRTLLECSKCRLREVVYLEEFESEVYQANRCIYLTCKRCREATIWNEAAHEPKEREPMAPPHPPDPPPRPAPAPRIKDERRHTRINCRLRACIRYNKERYDEEILEVNDVSRGGVRFNTRRYLAPGTKIEIAVPYSPGMANIFVPAEIVRLKAIPDKNLYECGAAYRTKLAGHGEPSGSGKNRPPQGNSGKKS